MWEGERGHVEEVLQGGGSCDGELKIELNPIIGNRARCITKFVRLKSVGG